MNSTQSPLAGLFAYMSSLLSNVTASSEGVQGWKPITAAFILAFGEPSRPLFVAVLVLWCCDLVLGLIWALMEKRINPRRMFYGAVKLLVYFIVLGASWQIRVAVPWVGAIVATVIDSYIALTEGASVLRNAAGLGHCCGFELPGIQRLAQYLDDQADGRVKGVTVTHAEVGIVIEHPTNPNEEKKS